MEKIAIISDIHGNRSALESVLKDIHSRNISRIFCLGDIVLKCANPDIVIDLVKENCEVVLKGNCDEIVASERALQKRFWSRVKIGEDRAKYLSNLPIMHEFYMSGHLIRLFHASPHGLSYMFNPMFSNKFTIYSGSELSNPMDLFDNTAFIGKSLADKVPDIVGYGHIHTPNIFRYKNKTIFNTGSVGIPTEMSNTGDLDDKTNRFSTLASYTILEGTLNSAELSTISITNVHVPYDIESEIKDLKASDMPNKESFILNLLTASSTY